MKTVRKLSLQHSRQETSLCFFKGVDARSAPHCDISCQLSNASTVPFFTNSQASFRSILLYLSRFYHINHVWELYKPFNLAEKNMMSPFLFKGWVISSSMVTCCHRFNKDRGRSTALVYSRLYLFNLSNTVSIDYEFDRSIECLLGPCHLLETQIPSSSMEEGSSKTKCWWWGWPMPDTSRRQRVDCLHAPSLLPRCPSSGNLQVFS